MALSLPNQLANLKKKIRIAAGLKFVESMEQMPTPQNPQELSAFMQATERYVNKICDKDSIVQEDENAKSVADLQNELTGEGSVK